MLPRRLQKNGWTNTHVASVVVLTLLGVAATLPAWIDILRIVLVSETHRYLVMVPVIVIWLVWVRRVRSTVTHPATGWPGLALTILGGCVYVIGHAAQVDAVWHLGAVLTMVGMLVTALGRDVAQRFAPAWAVLLLLVPLPAAWAEGLGRPIRIFSADLACRVYQSLGVQARLDLENDAILFADAAAPLRDASGGLGLLLVMILICYGYAFGLPLRQSVRGLVLLVSPVMAVLCNALATVATAWLYGSLAFWQADVIHLLSEWVLLLTGFFVLVGVIRLLGMASVPVRTYTLVYSR